MAKKTYKQWFDFHYKKLKKQFPEYGENVLKMMAGDAASKSVKLESGAPAGSVGQSAVPAGFAPETPRVGPSASPMPIPTSPISKRPTALPPVGGKPTAAPSTAEIPAPGGVTYNERIEQRIKATGAASMGPFQTTVTTGTGKMDIPSFIATLQTDDWMELRKTLGKLGYSKSLTIPQMKTLLIEDLYIYFPVVNFDTLIAKLSKDILPGAGEEAQLPQRRMQQVDRGTLIDIANLVSSKTLMMEELPKEILDEVIKDWERKAERGTLTTVKKVRNPKTGKMEEVVSTKGGFMQDLEEQRLAERLKAEMPQQAELAEGIGFADELKKLLAGGM